MTNAKLRLFLISTVAAGGTLAAAQTATATHHTTTATHHTAAHTPVHSECVTVPALSPNIPALPAGSPCPRALFTISERLDYVNPLVGPEVRQNFSNLPMIFTLAYVDARIGTGELARPHLWYTVKYTGYLPDGSKFDSSYDHDETKNGLSFPYGAHQVIPGWDTGFEGMHVGGKRRLFIPYQLAYGERGRPPMIPARAELVFDMELVAQSTENPNPRPAGPPPGMQPGAQPGAQPGMQPGARPGFPGQPAQPGQPGQPTPPGHTNSLPSTPPTGVPSGSTPHATPPSPGTSTTPPPAQPQS